MSKNDASKILAQWMGKSKNVKAPPRRGDAEHNLELSEHAPALGEPSEQVNFKVPLGTRKRLRVLAAAEGTSMLRLFFRMLELYEEKHKERYGLDEH